MIPFSEILVQAENSLCTSCHMLNANGNVLTIEEFQDKFKIKTNYLYYPLLISVIPSDSSPFIIRQRNLKT